MKIILTNNLIKEIFPYPYLPNIGDEIHWDAKPDKHDPDGLTWTKKVGIVTQRVFDVKEGIVYIILKGPSE